MRKNKFKNPSELQALVDEYFLSLEPERLVDDEGAVIKDKNGVPIMSERKPATISSLAYAVGLTSKEEFIKLREKEKYEYVIKRALLRTEAYMERLLFDKSASGGAKYLLQESFGHGKDTQGADFSGGVVILPEIEE